MVVKKKKIIESNKEDWANFTMGYLRLAELGLSELVNERYKDKDQEFKVEEIYLPSLFNLKHAIEIFLKLLSMELLNKEFFDESYFSHNTEELFNTLRKNIGEQRLNKAIEKHEKKHPDEVGRLKGKNIFDELEKIVTKYHTLSPLKNKIGSSYEIRDIDNTGLRYPINSLTIDLKYNEILKKVVKLDALEAFVDSVNLQKIFWQIYYLIYLERVE